MKKLILVAAVLLVAGAVLCVAAAASMHFDFGKLDTGNYETNAYPVEESFRSISVAAANEDITFRPSGDGTCRVVCLEEENVKHTVAVKDGTLTIRSTDERKLTDRIGFYTRETEISVYLPERVYEALRIETDTGDIELPADFSFDSIQIKGDTADVTCLASAKGSMEIALTTGDISIASVTAGSLELRTTSGRIRAQSVTCAGGVHVGVRTGKAYLQDLSCGSLTSEGTTGDVKLTRVIAADTISITRDTGDVEFIESDAASVFVQTDTGDVTGSLRSEKVFLTGTNTGKVAVPAGVNGGRCEIRTDTGDIRIEIC